MKTSQFRKKLKSLNFRICRLNGRNQLSLKISLLVNYYLKNWFLRLAKNPLKFPASPSSILFDQLKKELKSQRAKTNFKLSTFKKIIKNDKIAEAFDNEYDWEISNSARLSIEFEKQEFEKPVIKKFGKPNKALAQYYLLHSLSSPDYQEKPEMMQKNARLKKLWIEYLILFNWL